ncbi:hypothetical protein Glove_75g3 [Diversispora epigaea]|uniref:Uncharacterized protein n=1 Tax=Diversispora epigaea TaxID=1348612 RepID=A0A397JB73_9GLOM|nr:hypothetical protein Glove_75g3 [Diversispora epigaea]
MGSYPNSNRQIEPELMRIVLKNSLVDYHLSCQWTSGLLKNSLKFLAPKKVAGSLAVTNEFDKEELQYFISLRHDTSNKIYGTEYIPGRMLTPSHEKVSIPKEVQKILCEWYVTLYNRKKKDVNACMEVTMNQHARLIIGNEIFGFKITGRHENNAIILVKWKAYRDGTSDIYPGEVQYYFEHTLTLPKGPKTHLLAYVKWYKNAPSSSIRFKHKFMEPEVSNTELWNGEYYEEEDGNRTEESVAGAHEASSVHGETGASQEIVSRKRRREDDDDSVPITRRDIKILLHHLEEQNEIIRRLDTEVSYVRKLLEKGGMGDFTSTDEFIKLKAKHRHRRGTIADKIQKTIFMTFGKNDLPKITTKSSTDVIKNWKESYEIKNAYRKFNDDIFCSQILQRCWTSRPSEEQSVFTISVIKYIFNPNIYSIQIKDRGIRHYMKKTQEKMNANEKIQFLEEEFNEEEEEGEEEDEEGEEGEEGEKKITQEVIEEIKGSGEDEEGEVLATGFAIR